MFTMVKETLGQLLKRLIKENHTSQRKLARASGIDRTYISQLANDHSPIGRNAAQKLAPFLGVKPSVLVDASTGDAINPEDILPVQKPVEVLQDVRKKLEWLDLELQKNKTNEQPIDSRRLPVLCRVPCGYPMPNEQEVEGYQLVCKDDLGYARDKEKLFVLIASGNSLAGDNIQDGDKLVVDPEPPDYPDGKIYAVRIGAEVTCKHVYHEKDKVKLVSSNDEYTEMFYNADDVEIRGLVILSGNWIRRYK